MHTFFGIHIADGSTFASTLPLALAVLLGGLIGLERELHGHPAGLRTHILVCVGSTLITLVSVHIGDAVNSKSDPARLAAQIVSGIGFLGAGAILREGATIRGLTTAASVWTTAGIGIALGAGPFYGELAVVTTAIVLFTLWGLNKCEDWIDVRRGSLQLLSLQIQDEDTAAATALARVTAHKVFIQGIHYQPSNEPHMRHMLLQLRLPRGLDRNAFLTDLADEPGVVSVKLD